MKTVAIKPVGMLMAAGVAVCAFVLVGLDSCSRTVQSQGRHPVPFRGTVIEQFMGGGSAQSPRTGSVSPGARPNWPSSGASAGKESRPREVADSHADKSPVAHPADETPPDSAGTEETERSGKSPEQGEALQDADETRPLTGGEANGASKTDSGSLSAKQLLKRASDLEAAGKMTNALDAYDQAIELTEKNGQPERRAAALSAQARILVRIGRDREALARLKTAIALHRELRNARARSLDYLLAGQILLSRGRPAKALSYLQEARKLLPRSEAHNKPDLLQSIATACIALGKHGAARDAYSRLLGHHAKRGEGQAAANVHLLLGDLQVSQSDFAAAQASFHRARAMYEKAGAGPGLAAALFRLAYLDLRVGDLKAAAKRIGQAESVAKGCSARDGGARPVLAKGLYACANGHMVQGIKWLTTALNWYERAGDRIMSARVKLALAQAERDRARLEAALQSGGRALRQFRALSDRGGEAGTLTLIADVYFAQGYVQKALEYAQEALAISRKVHDPRCATRARVLLAEIHSTLGDTDFAWKLLKEASEDASRLSDKVLRGRVKLGMARFRLHRDSSEKAAATIVAARKDFDEADDRRGKADCDLLLGQVFEQRGDRDQALTRLQWALKTHRAMWDRMGEGKDLTALGVYYKNSGDYEKARQYFNKAMEIRQGIGNRGGYAANLANLGNLLKHGNHIADAVRHLNEALEVYRQLSDKKGEADMLANLGNVLAARGSHSEALEKLNAALALHREIQDVRGISVDLASLGRLFMVKGDLTNAAAYLSDAERINAKIVNPRGTVAILAEKAMLERARRNSARALQLLREALKKAKAIEDARAVSSLRLKMAVVLEDAGQKDQALSILKETLTNLRKQGDRKGELWALGELGILQVKMGHFERGLDNLHQAVALRSELGLPSSFARDLDFYLGEIYEGFKDYDRSLDHYHKALAVAQISSSDSVLGRLHHRIGNIYYQIQEYDKAADFFEDALRAHSEIHDLEMQKRELIRLGDIATKLGDEQRALQHQLKALALTQETGDPRTEARILTRIGTLYQKLGRQRTALQYYEKAKDTRIQLGDSRGVNENLLQIALVESTLGRFNSAVELLKEAFRISQKSEDHRMLWKAYFIMGRALQDQRRLGEALESYRKAINILEAMEADIVEESEEDNFIFGGKNALFETTLKVLMRLARKDPDGAYDNQALRIVEKLKAAEFENLLSRINVESVAELPNELLIKEKSLRLGLRKLDERLSDTLSQVRADQREFRELIEKRRRKEKSFKELKARIVREYPAYAHLRYPRPVSVHHLQKEVLRDDEALLEFMVTRSRTYIFAIDKNRFHTYSVAYARKDLERDVRGLLRPLRRQETRANWDPSIAFRLYDKLVKPVEYFLVGKKVVMLVPHGPLHSLPFEALVSSEQHAGKRFWSPTNRPAYLVERYAFCYAPSAAVLSWIRTREREREAGWNLVAFGDAAYSADNTDKELNKGADKLLAALSHQDEQSRGGGLGPLPGARQEITEIVRIVGEPTQVYVGPVATETLFKRADLGRYGYVHLATHGVLLPGAGKLWQQPAVVFSLYGDNQNDGFLELGEVFGLKLNCDLLVLSSCFSSKKYDPGLDRALQGISRAFLFAGADSVIMSMWQVNDESTARLFIEMYRRLSDASKAEALRDAKIALLEDQRTSHPYYWAPFVLTGNWQVKFRPTFNRPDPKELRFQGLSSWRKLLSL